MSVLRVAVALFVLLLTGTAWANAPAPWAVCEGFQAGDPCGDAMYYPGGTCTEHPATDCPTIPDGGLCLWCEASGPGPDSGVADGGTPADAAARDSGSEADAVAQDSASGPDGGYGGGGGGCSIAPIGAGTGTFSLAALALTPLLRRRRYSAALRRR